MEGRKFESATSSTARSSVATIANLLCRSPHIDRIRVKPGPMLAVKFEKRFEPMDASFLHCELKRRIGLKVLPFPSC